MTFQDRVYEEKKELDEKRGKLIEFISGDMFQTLSMAESLRLQNQLVAMTEYSNILGKRIEAFHAD